MRDLAPWSLFHTVLSIGAVFALWPLSTSIAADGFGSEAYGTSIDQKPAQGLTVEDERLAELDLLSDALIEKAAEGNSPAHQFRIEARMYRELLRQFMLEDRGRPQAERVPQRLLLEMVRMSALLHSASECKTGFVIICPPDLMRQLKAQQIRIDQGLQWMHVGDE